MKLIGLKQLRVPLQPLTLRRVKMVLVATLMPFCLTQAVLGSAQTYQSLEEIRDTAKKFLEEKQVSADNLDVEVSIGSIDRRLRLANCGGKLEAFLPQHGRKVGKVTVGIRCTEGVKWKVFVPAKVNQFEHAWVLNKSLSPNETLTKKDVVKQRVALTNGRQTPMRKLTQLVNTSPRKRMRAGTTVYQDSVCLVCKGESVRVTANNAYLSINVAGIALDNANLGERVQVRNSSSKKIFDAIVTGKNQLNINIAGSR